MSVVEAKSPESIICPCCLQFVEGLDVLADPTSCRISVAGKSVRLKRQWFNLANYLLIRFPLLATRDQIYHAVFMDERGEGPEAKIIDVTVSQLRPVLSDLGFAIETVYGRGYKLVKADGPEEIKAINSVYKGRRSKP